MSDSKALRDAAAFLLAKADEIDGKPSTFLGVNLFDPKEAWAQILREIAERRNPHEWREWGNGNPLPENVGNNERESPLYESHKTFWSAMDRLGVKDSKGERFNAINCVRRGGWADFEHEVRFLWANHDGIAWRADPRNKDILPKVAP